MCLSVKKSPANESIVFGVAISPPLSSSRRYPDFSSCADYSLGKFDVGNLGKAAMKVESPPYVRKDVAFGINIRRGEREG